MTVSEVEGHDLLVDLLLTKHCLRITTIVQTSVNEAGVVGVEPDKRAFENMNNLHLQLHRGSYLFKQILIVQ